MVTRKSALVRSSVFAIIVAMLSASALAATEKGRGVTPEQAKQALRDRPATKKGMAAPKNLGAVAAACQAEYNKLSNDYTANYNQCVAEATAPAGSPLANFNNASNAQLASICGDLSLMACVDKIRADQAVYCEANAKPSAREIASKEIECKAASANASAACASLAAKATKEKQDYVTSDAAVAAKDKDIAAAQQKLKELQSQRDAAAQQAAKDRTELENAIKEQTATGCKPVETMPQGRASSLSTKF